VVVLREELTDLRQVIMIYNVKKARNFPPLIQQKLWDLLNLGSVQSRLQYIKRKPNPDKPEP